MSSQDNAAHAPVRVIVLPNGEDTYALMFELHNAGADPVNLSCYEPFMDFEVIASAGESPVPVHQPALDIAVREVSVRVAEGGATFLPTPVRLRIREGAEAGVDGFLWTIPRDPDAVWLQVLLHLPPPFNLPARFVLR